MTTPVWYGYGGQTRHAPVKPCIIVDLDGTLANNEHRQHFMEGKKNWAAFFRAMNQDSIYLEVKFIIDLIFKHSHVELLLCTGRPAQYHDITRDWLAAYDVNYSAMLMRGEKDGRSDVVVKKDMLDAIRSQGFEVMFCIDDRPEVVEMWRAHGIRVLQCDAKAWESRDKALLDMDPRALLDENERLRAQVRELQVRASV